MSDRDEQGHFLPGHNMPGPGRPPRGDGESALIRQQLSPHREKLVNRCLELALAGDAKMMQIALQYLGPALKAASEPVYIPQLKTATTMEQRAMAVISALADGDVSAEAADKVLRVLKQYSDSVAIDELRARMDHIEGKPTKALPAPANPEPEQPANDDDNQDEYF